MLWITISRQFLPTIVIMTILILILKVIGKSLKILRYIEWLTPPAPSYGKRGKNLAWHATLLL